MCVRGAGQRRRKNTDPVPSHTPGPSPEESGMEGCQGVRAGVQPCRSPAPAGGREQGFVRATPVKEPYTGRQECKGNKFPCQETQTSVYLCAISQPKMVQSIDPLLPWEERPCARSISCKLVVIIAWMGSFGGTMKKAWSCILEQRACPPTRSRRYWKEWRRQEATSSSKRDRRGPRREGVV